MKKIVFLFLLLPLVSEAQFSIRNVGFLGILKGNRAKLATPSSLAASVGSQTVDLSWGAVTNAQAYTLSYSTDPTFASGVTTLGTATNSKHLSGLVDGTTYYWKVRASATGYTASSYAIGASFTPVGGGAGPTLLFASIDGSLKNYIALHYSAALDNTSIPKAHDFHLATASNHFIVGELPKAYSIQTPASTVVPITNTGGWGASLASYSFMDVAHRSRIRYNDTVIKVRFWVGNIDDSLIQSVKVEFWRPGGVTVGSSFHRTYSIEILNLLTPNSINTITLPSYAIVKEDDRVGISVASSSYVHGNLFATETAVNTGSSIYPTGMYWQGTTSLSDAIWSNSLYENVYIPIQCITKNAPLICHIGDSNVEGYPTNTSDVNIDVVGASGISETFRTTVAYKLGVKLGCNVVNMGVSGQIADDTRARFWQVIQSNPMYVIIGATTNGSTGDFVTQYVKMVDTAVAAGIIVFVNSVQPATTSDTWAPGVNHALDSAVTLHGGHFVDTWSALVDTAAGNYHKLLPVYQSDAIHINSAGMSVVAQIDADSISRYLPVRISGSNVYIRANRPYSATDKEYISYNVGANAIRAGVGANATTFTSDTVRNNLTLAPEDIFFDVTASFGEVAPQEWTGSWGQADKKMPNTGISWIGVMPGYTHAGVSAFFLLSNDRTAINNFLPNSPYDFAQIGWQGSGTGYVWPIQPNTLGVPTIQQSTNYPDTFAYNAIYREGANFYLAGSNDNSTWVKRFQYSYTSSKPEYIWVYGYAYHPAGYGLIPIDAPDNMPPTFISITARHDHAVLVESDERLYATTAGFTLHNVTANSNVTISTIEEVPEHNSKFYYQFITSSALSATDSFTLSYNPSTGSTTDTAAIPNELLAFTSGVINRVAVTEQNIFTAYSIVYTRLDSVASNTSGMYAHNSLFTPAQGSAFGDAITNRIQNPYGVSVIVTPQTINDFYYVTIRKHGTPLSTSSADTAIGYGVMFINYQIYGVSNDGAGNITYNNYIGGGPYQNHIWFRRDAMQVRTYTPDGAGGWQQWGSVTIPSYLAAEDWDLTVTVMNGYLFYPVMARL